MSDGFHARGASDWIAPELSTGAAEGWGGLVVARGANGFRRGYAPADELVILSRPTSLQAESIGSLRSHLRANHMRDGRRSLAICAATAGVGTSFIAANLAVSLAMSGASILLIDGNLRDPSLHNYILPERKPAGLRDYLADERMDVDDIVQHAVLPNLSLVYASAAGSDAQRLLASRKLDHLLDSAMRDFDMVIVDTPPSARYGDARRIAAALHHAMIVARKSTSFVADVRTLAVDLKADRVRVVGGFVNDFKDAA
jgi:protein-tyrosine kinase